MGQSGVAERFLYRTGKTIETNGTDQERTEERDADCPGKRPKKKQGCHANAGILLMEGVLHGNRDRRNLEPACEPKEAGHRYIE